MRGTFPLYSVHPAVPTHAIFVTSLSDADGHASAQHAFSTEPPERVLRGSPRRMYLPGHVMGKRWEGMLHLYSFSPPMQQHNI
ncbi:hypothetical protein ACLOJK_020051 [Asimina triloba]